MIRKRTLKRLLAQAQHDLAHTRAELHDRSAELRDAELRAARATGELYGYRRALEPFTGPTHIALAARNGQEARL